MAKVGAISKAQKYQKDFKVSSIPQYLKNPKVGPNWRAAAAFIVAKHQKIEGGPFENFFV